MLEPYYERNGCVIFHGDCREILPQLGPVDHVITDPPYEAAAHTQGRRVKRTEGDLQDKWAWRDTRGVVRYETLDFPPLDDCTRSESAQQFARLALRWVLVFSQAEGGHLWETALIEAGLTRRRWCVWVKPDAQPQFSGDRPGVGYETIVATHTAGRSTWNGGGKVGVFRHNKSNGESGHQTEKPIDLMRELVDLFTDPGDTILDPFMGSGTTLVAAFQLHRKAIGIELEEKWCRVAKERLAALTEPLPLYVPETSEQSTLL